MGYYIQTSGNKGKAPEVAVMIGGTIGLWLRSIVAMLGL